jgi:hypothetical protein
MRARGQRKQAVALAPDAEFAPVVRVGPPGRRRTGQGKLASACTSRRASGSLSRARCEASGWVWEGGGGREQGHASSMRELLTREKLSLLTNRKRT